MEQGVQSRGVSGKGKAQRRVLWFGAVLLAAIVLVGAARVPILREVASFLIVEDSLKPAAAIVALGGQAPFRQIEAARLYHAGWAPLVFVVQEGPSDEAEALRELGIQVVPEWELSRQVLLRRGVPASAIIVPKGKSIGTLEELQAAYAALEQKDAPVILVTSKYHTRRTPQDLPSKHRYQGINSSAPEVAFQHPLSSFPRASPSERSKNFKRPMPLSNKKMRR